ncbi:CIC11C00000005005 [Sungouiella intermedia]|uniref:CIC11C00000005005 n=1 Tax=Sungouiella intermedia TaxID=45354 RepID=A0A1L0C088_9ASCO|nr:CIC11C00000005005 [[Candida] intermedia]
MSYRGPNQFNNQFNLPMGSPMGVPQPSKIGPVSTQLSSLEKFEAISKKIENILDDYFSPVKPYVPGIGRLFIVATFYEDAMRIFSQWSEQVYYLHVYRRYWKWLTVLFLVVNIVTMFTASTLLVLRKHLTFSTVALCLVVVFQGIFYGLIFDSQFLLRNLSVVGGLILAFSDSLVRDKRALPGLPMIGNQDNKKYFLLAGRLLLIFLFLGFVFSANWSFVRVIVILVGLSACTSIVVGYKTKVAAAVLTLLLFSYNMAVNQFWKYLSYNANRDFLKYEFFQTLSIVGGLLIIVNAGAGELSIDEKKKIY